MKMLFLNLTWVSVFTRLSWYRDLCSKANVFLTEICYFKHSENKKKGFQVDVSGKITFFGISVIRCFPTIKKKKM